MFNRYSATLLGISAIWLWLAGGFLVTSCNVDWFTAAQRRHIREISLPAERVTAETHNTIDFLCRRQPLHPLLYTQREMQHLEDVRGIFRVITSSVVIAIATLGLSLGVVYHRRQVQLGLRAIRYSAIATLVVLGAIALLVCTQFDAAFLLLHQLLFRNQFWLLDPTTEFLVVVFPETVFADFGITLWLVWVAGCGLFALLPHLVRSPRSN